MEMNPKLIRQKYYKFVYSDYSFSLSEGCLFLQYEYKIEPDFVFKHKICFEGIEEAELSKKDPHELDNFVFNIGLSEIPSYWKLTAAAEIVVEAGYLNNYQVEWWHDLFMKGMGQYFYENNIDFTDKNFLNFKVRSNRQITAKPSQLANDKVLVPIGGGKDSTVTLELMQKNFPDTATFIVNPSREASYVTTNVANVKNRIIADRIFDPLLFLLNKKGFINGHVPVTATISFLSIFAAYLKEYAHVAFSNELGSSEGNVNYFGQIINHQYSKTLEFENKFRDYNNKILSDINYFSFLRPLYDIQITKIFSKMPKYFAVIKSCNVEAKTGTWCGKCAKCLSTFILLYAHLGKSVKEIFPSNLYEDEELLPLMESLMDESKVKPFECIGTREELKVGLFMSLIRHKKGKLPILLKRAKEYLLLNEKDLKDRTQNLLGNWSENNNLNINFTAILKGAYNA
jgi:UDP-N-acetyl-alpha-D-muramoyl-L-alanyl-L-glutamate epimerase